MSALWGDDAMNGWGHAVRDEWALDPGFLTLNHGSYGATPKMVLAAQDAWRQRMEAQPTRFFRREMPGALRHAADALAQFLGARGQDLAFVENATSGCNAVLRSLRLSPGDEIVVLDHVYGAVRNTVRFVAERAGAKLVAATVPFPRPMPDDVVAAVAASLGPRTRLAVIDHITSPSALVLPIARIVAACHAAGVPVLVDGAHGPGHVDIDLTAIDADWYAGNCHKWLNAAKGCAFLWARPDRQEDLHPVSISHGFQGGFLAEFDWTGTCDPSAFLSVTAALDFHERLGGAALRARNATLAFEASAMVAGRLGTETGGGNEVSGAMGLVRLPGPGTVEHAAKLRELLMDLGTDTPVHALSGSVWMRLSAQAYNDMADYERLAGIAEKALAP
jgi:isopenicillin-N epimerase